MSATGSNPIITLTTDFGTRGGYVAQMKGAILSICPAATLVDVSHDIPPQDIEEAAWLLGDLVSAFPPHAIHLVVVDPGVGTQRRLLAIATSQGRFVGPDNGVLDPVTEMETARRIVVLDDPRWWRSDVSHTFHGRDVLGPVAAHWAAGTPLEALGSSTPHLNRLALPAPVLERDRLIGQIVRIDAFGNLITNIRLADVRALLGMPPKGDASAAGGTPTHASAAATPSGPPPDEAIERPARGATWPSLNVASWIGNAKPTVVLCGQSIGTWRTCYGDDPPGKAIVLFGSSGWLEIAVVQGSAQSRWGAAKSTPVEIGLHPLTNP